jgi:DNA-binding protein HU-beta
MTMVTAKKAAKKKARLTVLYSSSGKKLYAVRDESGRFKDIQQYSRARSR